MNLSEISRENAIKYSVTWFISEAIKQDNTSTRVQTIKKNKKENSFRIKVSTIKNPCGLY